MSDQQSQTYVWKVTNGKKLVKYATNASRVRSPVFELHDTMFIAAFCPKYQHVSGQQEPSVGIFIASISDEPLVCKFDVRVKGCNRVTGDSDYGAYRYCQFSGYKNVMSYSELQKCVAEEGELVVKITLIK